MLGCVEQRNERRFADMGGHNKRWSGCDDVSMWY
jgi:hypothetical protein